VVSAPTSRLLHRDPEDVRVRCNLGKAADSSAPITTKQPGDPAKAAAAVLHIASLTDPPLRLLLGSDAVRFVEQNDLAKMDSDRKVEDLASPRISSRRRLQPLASSTVASFVVKIGFPAGSRVKLCDTHLLQQRQIVLDVPVVVMRPFSTLTRSSR